MTKPPVIADYPSLLRQVRSTLVEGQERIEQEKVRTYWETGRLIHTHILKHKDRAEYGTQVIKRLAKDLDADYSNLQRCVQFAKVYPRLPIVGGRRQFNWSHYRKLITIPDDKKRLALEQAVLRNEWSADELASRIQASSGNDHAPKTTNSEPRTLNYELLTPLRGQLYTYQLVERPTMGEAESGLLVDLGFGTFHTVPSRLLSSFSKDDIIVSRDANPRHASRAAGSPQYRFYKADRTAKDLYTYQAYVEKIIDADTIKVRLDLGFNVWSRQVLRLRDLNAPELDTKEGAAAKAFVQSHIKEAQMIIVRSSRSDKYDRYLADIFLPIEGEAEIYLNNLLLEKGFAQRWQL